MAFVAGVAATVTAWFIFHAVGASAAPGDGDATFVPITPCRLIDTRPLPDRVGPHGAFGAGQTKTIAAVGVNGTCAIPADAVGLGMNVTAVGASASTFLTFWPTGTRPTTASLNPAPGQPPTPNAVTTGLSPTGTFNIYNLRGTVNVIVDVSGYYTSGSLRNLDTRLKNVESALGGLPANSLIRVGGTSKRVAEDMPDCSPGLDYLVDSFTAPADGFVMVSASFTTQYGPYAFGGDFAMRVERRVPPPGTSLFFPTIGEWMEQSSDTGGKRYSASLNQVLPVVKGSNTIVLKVCDTDDRVGVTNTAIAAQMTYVYTPFRLG